MSAILDRKWETSTHVGERVEETTAILDRKRECGTRCQRYWTAAPVQQNTVPVREHPSDTGPPQILGHMMSDTGPQHGSVQ